MAEQFLEEYHVNKAFLSCKGVHLERGISESNELQARVKRKMVAMADQVFVLADGSKFDVQAFTMISGWDGIHSVITDSQAPAGHVQSLQRRAIEVILAG
ncbi:hypothetical protein N6H14_31690 [Paenibacillus sp. CC-CFT747]|nr:hypothetical protein N6H14_31690 [Paenibacillus sp. CC-CFT747]